MLRIILCCFFLTTTYIVGAQLLTIVDSATRQPLELVTIYSEAPSVYATTDSAGQVDLTPFAGAPRIAIQMLGYQPIIRSYQHLKRISTIALAADQVALEQIVVSATRWNQSRREVPAKIRTISQRDIALTQPQTAADLLGSSGEVFIQKSQLGGGSPMIRGFSTNRLLYTVDGVRMNTAIFRSGNLHNVISLDPFALQSAEILFGPGSVIYGSDAIGGVMAFQTLEAPFSNTNKRLFTGGSTLRHATASGERTAHVHGSLSGTNWSVLSSITTTRYGDLRMGSHGPTDYLRPGYVVRIDGEDRVVLNGDPRRQRPTGYRQWNVTQKVRYRPHPDWELRYGLHVSRTSDFPRYDRLLRTRNGLPRSAEWQYSPQKWLMQLLEVRHDRGNRFYDQMHLRLAHQQFAEGRIDRDFNARWRTDRQERVRALSANLDLQKRLTDRSRLFYGAEVVGNHVRSTGSRMDIETGAQESAPSRYPQATWAAYAAYLNYQLRLHPTLLLQLGGRYSVFSIDANFRNNLDFYPFPESEAQLQHDAFTASLGATYHPNDRWSFSGQLATGFRAPNVDDIGKVFDSEPGAVVVPNPGLQAEYAYNAEVGLARQFGRRVKIDLALYSTWLDQALVRRNFQLNGQDSIRYDGELSQVQAIQNAAEARVYGLQAGLELKLPAGFGFTTLFSIQQGEEELEDGRRGPSRHAAPAFGQTTLSFKRQRLEVRAQAVYHFERSFEDLPLEERAKTHLYALDSEGNPYSPGWYTLDLRGLYQITDHLLLSGGLENLTDQRYRPYSSGLAGAGRQVVIAISAKW